MLATIAWLVSLADRAAPLLSNDDAAVNLTELDIVSFATMQPARLGRTRQLGA